MRSASHPPLFLREIKRSWPHAILFVLCMALGLSGLTANTGLTSSVESWLKSTAQEVNGGDVIIRSDRPLSAAHKVLLEPWIQSGKLERTSYVQLRSVARVPSSDRTLLAEIKVVEPDYPFYGEVRLRSGNPLSEGLRPGTVVVSQNLLERLDVAEGGTLQVGFQSFTIVDVVEYEPDRPLEVFSLGPRIFVSEVDRDALGLIETGSRVRFVTLLKLLDPSLKEALVAPLKEAAEEGRERVETAESGQTTLNRFIDRFAFFLQTLAFFLLLLAGLGIYASLRALLGQQIYSIAIMKSLGTPTGPLLRHFLSPLLVLGGWGILLGILGAQGVLLLLGRSLTGILPEGLSLSLGWAGVREACLLGVGALLVFAWLPLRAFRRVRPMLLFRPGRGDLPGLQNPWPLLLLGLSIFLVLLLWKVSDPALAGLLVLVLSGTLGLTWGVVRLSLAFLRSLKSLPLLPRLAFRSLLRRPASTTQILLALTTSMTVIFSLYLLAENLERVFGTSFPPGAPNLFYIDIQPDQAEPFQEAFPGVGDLYPVVRGRLTKVQGRSIDPNTPYSRFGDSIRRVFNLTYRDRLLPSERLVEGEGLFRTDWAEPQVSVLDSVKEMVEVKIGDRLVFNIQGVPIQARVSSFRTRQGESTTPFFYFVFQEATLGAAPKTYFAAQRVDREAVAGIQVAVVKAFPNVTTIDVSETVLRVTDLLSRLVVLIQFLAGLGILAGLFLLLSATLATRAERLYEGVYYQVVGARTSFVQRIFLLESATMGLLATFLSAVMADLGARGLCVWGLGLSYQSDWSLCLWAGLGVTCLLLIIAYAFSRSILRQKPVILLRSQYEV